MKKLFFSLTVMLSLSTLIAQNVGINTNTPHASAALDVVSTTQGVLVPRMTQSDRNLIASPATGLLVYQTDATPGFYFYNGSAWTSLSGGGSSYTAGTGISIAGNVISNTGDNDNSSTNEIELPSQSGQSGKYLTTNGTSTSWATVSGGAIPSHNMNLFTAGLSATLYYALTGSSTLSNAGPSPVESVVDITGTISSFRLRCHTFQGGGNNNCTLTLVKNGIDTGLTTTFSVDPTIGNTVTATASGSTVSVVPGDRLCWKLVQSAPAQNWRIALAFTFN